MFCPPVDDAADVVLRSQQGDRSEPPVAGLVRREAPFTVVGAHHQGAFRDVGEPPIVGESYP